MNIRFLFLLSLIVLIFPCLSAGKLAPSAALERVVGASDSNLRDSRSMAGNSQKRYTLVYTSPAGSYYVFNRSTGGYIVVSGDDRVYALLADVASGNFVKSEVAPAAAYMLDVYELEIQSLGDADGEAESGIMDYYSEWKAIEPLMTTTWDQHYPYNIYCPVVGSSTCVTGCVATAMAQMVRCIGYYAGSGYRSYSGVNSDGNNVEFDYGAYSFDFDNMFDSYPATVTSEQIDQVGSLMLACGLSVSMGYGVSGSGAQSSNVPEALVRNFGYDKQYTRIYARNDFSQAQWENMLYTQLRLRRPVYYSGSNGGSGHAFVIDGYRPMGMYHVNWGWSGLSDGYYRLSALNPAQQGIGGSSGGYSLDADMVVAVPPDADPGVVIGDMTGSISIVTNGVYAVYYKCGSSNLLNTAIGVAIVDSFDNIVSTATFWTGQNLTAWSALRHDSYSYDFSQYKLSPGNYRIYPAYCPDGGSFTITEPYTQSQPYVLLEVTADGDYISTNPPSRQYSSDLHIAGVNSNNDLHSGYSGNFGFYAVNNGGKDYSDEVFTITMLDGNGDDLVSFSSNRTTIAAEANGYVTSAFPVFDSSNNLIQAGIYPLRFADSGGSILSEGEFCMEVGDGSPLRVWTNSEKIEVTNTQTMPSALMNGDYWPHTPLIKATETNRSMTLRLAFYPPSSMSATTTVVCYQGTINPMESTFPLEPIKVDVPFGIYEVCYRKGYTQISQRQPMHIGVAVDNICYLPADDGGASASLMQKDRGLVETVIPHQVTVNGKTLPVTAIDNQAFIMQPSLAVVDIPAGVKTIGMNAFSSSALRQIIIRAEEPPFAHRNFVAAGLGADAAFYVPASAYQEYSTILADYNRVYTIVDEIQSAEMTMESDEASASIAFAPAHQAVDPDFVVTPVDAASAAVAEVSVESVASGKINLRVKALSAGEASFIVAPAHRSDNYGVLSVTVPKSVTGIDEVEMDAAAQWPADIFTTTGILLRRGASESDFRSLPRGIYILSTPSGVRKQIL